MHVVDVHGRFAWYELVTTDAQAAKVFYSSVMGWGALDASVPGAAYTLFTAGSALVGGLMELSADARDMGANPSWLGYVGVDDVDAAADRVTRLGGTVHVPPTDIPAVSRFSIFTDPQVARLALLKWLDPRRAQPAALDDIGRVGWHELLAADRKQALTFYGALFGWQRAHADVGEMGTYQLFSAAGRTIGGMLTKPPTIPTPFWLYYFNVEDLDAAAQRVQAGGGEVIDGPFEVPGGSWIVQCTDPQGAMFALEATRGRKAVGYFERAAAADPSGARRRRWSW
jgi:predicted enzyme related to lactoylglutathione lyase